MQEKVVRFLLTHILYLYVHTHCAIRIHSVQQNFADLKIAEQIQAEFRSYLT